MLWTKILEQHSGLEKLLKALVHFTFFICADVKDFEQECLSKCFFSMFIVDYLNLELDVCYINVKNLNVIVG